MDGGGISSASHIYFSKRWPNMIDNETEFLQGSAACRNGKVPEKNASNEYLKGYAHAIDRLPNHERTKRRAMASGRLAALNAVKGDLYFSVAMPGSMWDKYHRIGYNKTRGNSLK